MLENHFWSQASAVNIQTGSQITGGFDVGFDSKIPEETKDAIMDFAYWVEDHFSLPVTLWVDLKYNHYLVTESGKRVAYKFYWADFQNYPVFENPDDIPVIELAVRTEKQSIKDILQAFIEAISMYFAWLSNREITVCEQTAQILQAYFKKENDHV